MTTRPPPSDVPLTRGIALHALARTARTQWGDGVLAEIRTRLPADVAAQTDGPELEPLRWYPSSHVVAWHRAMYEGPCKYDEREFADVVQRSLDYSMGIVRRTLMRVLTPEILIEQAARLWREFQTHGEMTVTRLGQGSVRMTLAGHPFVEDPVSRKVVAIMSRHMAARSRAKEVRESHAMDAAGRLVVTVSWRT